MYLHVPYGCVWEMSICLPLDVKRAECVYKLTSDIRYCSFIEFRFTPGKLVSNTYSISDNSKSSKLLLKFVVCCMKQICFIWPRDKRQRP